MDKKLENYFQKTIFPDLEKGRLDFDKPHTLAVVHWIKKIIENSPDLNLDEDVLIIAAYAHDWGYADLFEDGKRLNLRDVKNVKAEHMKLGAEKIEEF